MFPPYIMFYAIHDIREKIMTFFPLLWHTETFNSQDLISNSPHCQSYSSCDVCLENLVLDQLIFP